MSAPPREWDAMADYLLPLSQAQRRGLAQSIAEHGVRVPVMCLPDGRIVDGHHRWSISNGSAPVEYIDMTDAAAFDLGIALNYHRRHMTPEQLSEVHERLRRDKQAQRDTAAAMRKAGATQAEVAAHIGVDQATISRWEDGSDMQTHNTSGPDLRVSVPLSEHQQIRRRAASEPHTQIAADYGITPRRVGQIAQIAERREPPALVSTPDFPPDTFRCIVIDPPWPVTKIQREERPQQGENLDYATMSLDDIETLPITELQDEWGCHLYLWVTHKYLPTGLRLLEAWDARYECMLTWVKPSGMTPYSWMYNTEHVLFARLGTSVPLERMGLKLSIEAATTGHSAKPEEFYDLVRQASPGPRLDMFARARHEGFHPWGAEVVA